MAKATDSTRPVHIVDSSGTIIDSFGGSGGTSALDDADFTAGANSGTPIMGVYESSPSSVTDGDLGIAGITQTRALRVSVDNSGDIGGGTQYTEDDVAPANPVGTAIVAQRDDALGGLTPAEGDWTHLYADANGALWVNPGTVPVTGTFWQTTQPVSAASLPLPSGAATAAKQPALGTAGTPSSDVITVQGVTSMTALVVDGSGVTQPVSGTVTANLSATDNAVLDTIDAVLDTINAKLVTGTVIGDVNLGATDNAVLDAIAASLALLDNAIASGNELQVDIVGSLPAGTNNIGDVDVLSLPATPAGTNLIGIASVAHNDTYYQGTTSRTIGRAIIDAATSGDNTLLSAQGASNIIRVHSLFLVSAGTVNVRFESGTGGTALTGQMNLVANTGFVLPYNPYGWFQTAANTLLNLELSAAISVDGAFQYSVVQ